MSRPPVLLVCMGVSGSGKSTVARYLASELSLVYFEADDFHSDENKALMAAGVPLNDQQREPWINSMCAALSVECKAGRDCILAYSGLRRQHRQQFRYLGFRTLFISLCSDHQTIADRLSNRAGHFMPAGMLASQIDAMQSADGETDVISVDNSGTLAKTLATARSVASSFLEPGSSQGPTRAATHV